MNEELKSQIVLHMANEREKRAELEAQLPLQRAQIIAQEAGIIAHSVEISRMCRSF